MVRPIVLLFQEFATQTATPTTPDLNCVIVGPAYAIQDYLTDKVNIEVSNYGSLEADNPYTPPIAFTAAITLAAPPNLPAGGWVDPASVKVYFDEVRVELESGTDGVVVNAVPNENTLTSASALFITAGVQAGDRLIIDGPDLVMTPNLTLTVLSVDSQTVLRVASNFTVYARGTLTATSNFANNDTVTVGTKTYTFQTGLVNVDGNVFIGVTASASLDNLIAAINLGAGAGTAYALAMTANGLVSASAGAGDTMIATSLIVGSIGSTYATTETSANASWGAATLVGGSSSLKYRVERRLTNQVVDSAFVVVPTFRQSNQITILGGVTLPVSNVLRTVMYARVYVASRSFRTDLQNLDSVNTTADITAKIGRIDSRNPLAAMVFVAKQNAGQAPIQFYGVYSDDLIGYNLAKDAISSDDSVYAIVPTTTDLTVIAAFKADNETQADPNAALNNGVPQKLRVVIGTGSLTTTQTIVSETLTATSEVLTGAIPSGIKTITLSSLSALTGNVKPGDHLVLSASENTASLDGTYTIAHINSATSVELDEALPITVGTPEGINYTITRPSTGATVVALSDNRATKTHTAVVYKSRVAGITPGARTLTLFQSNAGGTGTIHSIVEVAGVSTIINGDWSANSITATVLVAAVNTGAGVVVSFSGSVNLVASTSSGGTTQNTALGASAISTGTPGIDSLTSTGALGAVFIRIYDVNAMFITAGVLAGDIIEIPSNPNGVYGTNTKQFLVDVIVSEQRLQIKNVVSGAYVNNTSTLESELPHADNRLGTGTLVTQGSIRYRVLRNLSKDQQVTRLVTNAQSLNSRRAILAWPDSVTVSGLVDGSKTPNADGTSAAADRQPGYYMAAVIGGMTAGLPSHQGFSRLGCAGIGLMTHASDYFSEKQLTDLSDGGWYVFVQNAPTALPYSIHQLTTDPATLEAGEYSIVKNFDFVSLFYLGILEPFLGIWNINNDTLGFIRQALNTGTESLKLRRVAKIGAPINSATITSLAVSPASADRVEVYIEVDLPKPLNVIGLHLVA